MDTTWRTSSYSGNQGHCVEARRDVGSVLVRDSRNRGSGHLEFPGEQWDAPPGSGCLEALASRGPAGSVRSRGTAGRLVMSRQDAVPRSRAGGQPGRLIGVGKS